MTEDETNDLTGLRKAYDLLNAGFESACEQMDALKQQVRQLTAERDRLREMLADQGAEFCPDDTVVLRCRLEGLSLDLLLGKE